MFLPVFSEISGEGFTEKKNEREGGKWWKGKRERERERD